jgi:hypothetical protein
VHRMAHSEPLIHVNTAGSGDRSHSEPVISFTAALIATCDLRLVRSGSLLSRSIQVLAAVLNGRSKKEHT